MSEPVLKMDKIFKEFPGVIAVNNVDLELYSGEVLALVGENGAGKSTLMKILGGSCICNSGTITVCGETVDMQTPSQALGLGISVIYQELNYCDRMSIAENIMIGQTPVKGKMKRVDYKTLREKSSVIQKVIGLDHVDPFTALEKLSVGQKQLVEIGKAYARNTKILVMDEPTSALNDTEVNKLFELVRKLQAEGVGIIYISHKLDEVMEISDRVQVMRDGRSVGVKKTSEITKDEIVTMMAGRELTEMYPIRPRPIGETIMEVKNLYTNFLKDISFELHSGEILGLYGLMGCGNEEVLQCLFGAHGIGYGQIIIDGKEVKITCPKDAVEQRVAYVPGERKTEGLVLKQSVSSNIALASLDRLMGKFRMKDKQFKEETVSWSKKLNVKTPSMETLADNLSGGNQQKVILAKWLMTNPKILLLNDPTKGIDVGAKVEIYKLMEELCKQGMGIIFVSSEMAEAMNTVDRMLILHEGKITGEYMKNEFTQERIMRSAIGG